jgi:hypothetical protein
MSSTPTPTTTSTPTESSSSQNNEEVENTKCENSTPLNYSIVRKQKIDKIINYYNELLKKYTESYTEYTIDSNSLESDARTYAETTIKPKAEAYNSQIIKLSKELIDTVDRDTELILDQKIELETKSKNIDTLMKEIKMLKNKKTDLSINEKSQKDSLNNTIERTEELSFTSQLYMGINILLVLLVLGLIIYLVYSNFTTTSNNSNSINNIYRNIK